MSKLLEVIRDWRYVMQFILTVAITVVVMGAFVYFFVYFGEPKTTSTAGSDVIYSQIKKMSGDGQMVAIPFDENGSLTTVRAVERSESGFGRVFLASRRDVVYMALVAPGMEIPVGSSVDLVWVSFQTHATTTTRRVLFVNGIKKKNQ